MSMRTVLGQPHWSYKSRPVWCPIGQVKQVAGIRSRGLSGKDLADALRTEYAAIAHALSSTGEDFVVVNLAKIIDQGGDNVGMQNESLCLEPGFPEQLYTFPRDAFMTVKRLFLTNAGPSVAMRINNAECTGLCSQFGEGGRVLGRRKTLLVAEALCINGEAALSEQLEDMGKIRDMGYLMATIPNPDGIVCGSTDKRSISYTDHLDRVGGLLEDRCGELYLVLDPNFRCYSDGTSLLSREDSRGLVQSQCESVGVEVLISPRDLEVPYSVGFYQTPGGRVVITSGDEAVAETVANIVGEENVYTTNVPIEYFPAHVSAGIHCLVTDIPRSFRLAQEV